MGFSFPKEGLMAFPHGCHFISHGAGDVLLLCWCQRTIWASVSTHHSWTPCKDPMQVFSTSPWMPTWSHVLPLQIWGKRAFLLWFNPCVAPLPAPPEEIPIVVGHSRVWSPLLLFGQVFGLLQSKRSFRECVCWHFLFWPCRSLKHQELGNCIATQQPIFRSDASLCSFSLPVHFASAEVSEVPSKMQRERWMSGAGVFSGTFLQCWSASFENNI